jgi:hypothetical protein
VFKNASVATADEQCKGAGMQLKKNITLFGKYSQGVFDSKPSKNRDFQGFYPLNG